MLIVSSILILNSCQSVDSSAGNLIEIDEDETVTILFSDSSAIYNEDTYYDALLEWQQSINQNPVPFKIIDASDKDIIHYFDINQFPTMLVISGEHVLLRLEGPITKDEILNHLTEIFTFEEELDHTLNDNLLHKKEALGINRPSTSFFIISQYGSAFLTLLLQLPS